MLKASFNNKNGVTKLLPVCTPFLCHFNFQPFQKVLSAVKVVSEHLGHSSASMALDVYSPEQATQKFAKSLQK
ncbi:hypothetical protein IC801_16265 [Geobacillus sp. 44B]|nr:hypothetical protein IC801_16265 [Geobacillus sp. 44B]